MKMIFVLLLFICTQAESQAYIGLDGGLAFNTFSGKGHYDQSLKIEERGTITPIMSLHVGMSWNNLFCSEYNDIWHDSYFIEFDERFCVDQHNPAHLGMCGGYELKYNEWSVAIIPGGYYRMRSMDIPKENYMVGGLSLRGRYKGLTLEAGKVEFFSIKIGFLGFLDSKH